MLLSFSVENYRSFGTEQTLNLLASKRSRPNFPSHHCCKVPGTEEHALRVAALYGANGAGKSNLVGALALLKRLVVSGASPGEPVPYKPFLLDPESPTKPTSFELQFLEEDEVFRYGICYDAKRVHEEWLDVYEGAKERNLFSRGDKEDGSVEVSLGPAAGEKNGSQKIRALAEVGARPNQPFMTEVVNLDDPKAQGPRFQRAVNWFKSTLLAVGPDTRFGLLPLHMLIAKDEGFAEFAGRFLREASTGIADLVARTEVIPRSELGSAFVSELMEGLSEGSVAVTHGPSELVSLHRILALHDSARDLRVAFPLNEESDGSKRLLDLLPALYRLTGQGGVFVIDELERSMHPMLARKFIESFLKIAPKSQSQLIFTTHESTLLDLDLLRRDGIWFAEKDDKGATQLYSLADFKVRKDLRIEKGYLEGRFGAIPFLGGIDHLIEEGATAEAEA